MFIKDSYVLEKLYPNVSNKKIGHFPQQEEQYRGDHHINPPAKWSPAEKKHTQHGEMACSVFYCLTLSYISMITLKMTVFHTEKCESG